MDTLNVININGKDYNMSSTTSEEYKKQYVESFGDELHRVWCGPLGYFVLNSLL